MAEDNFLLLYCAHGTVLRFQYHHRRSILYPQERGHVGGHFLPSMLSISMVGGHGRRLLANG